MLPLVVFIEDNQLIARAMRRALSGRCAFTHAGSLSAALPIVEAGGYSAVVSDWLLGDGTGDVALARCAACAPNARRVFFTSQSPARLRDRVAPGLAHAILEKSCDLETLVAAIGLV